jgi:hypothetical protein
MNDLLHLKILYYIYIYIYIYISTYAVFPNDTMSQSSRVYVVLASLLAFCITFRWGLTTIHDLFIAVTHRTRISGCIAYSVYVICLFVYYTYIYAIFRYIHISPNLFVAQSTSASTTTATATATTTKAMVIE